MPEHPEIRHFSRMRLRCFNFTFYHNHNTDHFAHVNLLELRKSLNINSDDFPKMKIALLGDSPTQLLSQAIRGLGIVNKMSLQLFDADIDQVDYQIFNNRSELYNFEPDAVVIFQSVQKLQEKFYETDEKAGFAAARISHLKAQISTLSEGLAGQIIYYNFPEANDGVFGNFANKHPASFLYQTRKLNTLLMEVAVECPNFHIADFAALQQTLGRVKTFAPNLYVTSSMILSPDALPDVAKLAVDIIAASKGKVKKCLVTDLDNTMWGGIIGDDGMSNIQIGNLGIGRAFSDMQRWMKQLKQRGILLAVCSKNNEAIAKEPFGKHPEMVLNLSDFAVFVANWESKVDNLHSIQSALNIGFDSMVFIDDNPFEREMVRKAIPDITVPEMPEDPAEYVLFLQQLNLFETASVTSEDATRTEQYQVEAKRIEMKKSFFNEEDYLKSLEMTAAVAPFNDFNFSRVAQLTQRSNQFNLRTVRYTDAEIKSMADDDRFATFTFQLNDKFGDYGIICVIILKKENKTLFIDTLLMSCRVLNRTVEQFVLNELMRYARENNFEAITGEYLPTPKNALVKDLLPRLGFAEAGKIWRLEVDGYTSLKTYVAEKL